MENKNILLAVLAGVLTISNTLPAAAADVCPEFVKVKAGGY